MIRTASLASVVADLHRHSSTVYAALRVNGRTGQSDCVSVAACDDATPDVKDAIHFWQLDDLRAGDLHPAVRRAHAHLLQHGWRDVELRRDGETSQCWARHPHEPYAVHLLTLGHLRRLAVSVSTAPFRVEPLP